jgi:ferric-dicitrate binding protein FerR (iron transport regulator)
MSSLPPDDLNRIADYIAEALSPDETEATERWIAEDGERQELVAYLRQSGRRSVPEQSAYVDVEAALAVVAAHIDASTSVRQASTNARHSNSAECSGTSAVPRSAGERGNLGTQSLPKGIGLGKHSLLWMAGFAVTAVFVCFGVLFPASHRTNLLGQRFQTAPGQRATVRLADGSMIVLAPASHAVMTQRTVEISGEAYIRVAPHSTRPFVVHTKNAVIRVLGTVFSVRQYPNESSSQVVVVDGKVAVLPRMHSDRGRAPTLLSAQMLAQVTDSGISVNNGISAQDYMVWTRGVLVFDRVALRDVVAELNRAYGVTIRVADTTLASQPVGLEVSVTEKPIVRVLTLIGEATESHYTYDGKTYVLVPGHTAFPHGTMKRQKRGFTQLEKLYGR